MKWKARWRRVVLSKCISGTRLSSQYAYYFTNQLLTLSLLMNKLTSILLVDDDETTNFINQMLLEDLEVTQKVLLAFHGREALEVIKRQCGEDSCPQLILLDINMPVMNGFEFLDAYEGLELAHKQSVVILMLTTSMNPGDVERLREKSIGGVLNKPLTKEMVKDLLHQHFNRQLPK